MGLKPNPSRLSKQGSSADEYSLPQKSNPSAPAPTQKTGSSRDRLARKRKPQGEVRGGGEPRSLLPQPATLRRLFAPPAITEVIPTCFMPQEARPSSQHEVPLDITPGTIQKGLRAAAPGGRNGCTQLL